MKIQTHEQYVTRFKQRGKKIKKRRSKDRDAQLFSLFDRLVGLPVYSDFKPKHQERVLSTLPVERITTGPNATPYIPKFIDEVRITESGHEVRTGNRIRNLTE